MNSKHIIPDTLKIVKTAAPYSNLDFDAPRTNNNEQPHYYNNINDIILLEDSIENLSRLESNKIDYYQDEELPDDFIILDHDKKNIILFLNQLRSNPTKLSIGTQIIRHWLFGQKLGSEVPEEVKKIQLSKNELDLFFKGSRDDINKYRQKYNITADNNPFGWILYHYDSTLFTQSQSIWDLINKHFGSVIEKYNHYRLRISYGIVSALHLRTDKKELIKSIEKFLEERGFDVSEPKYFNDQARNGEPVLLWISKNYLKGNEYKAAIGINFGFDNGLSGFRFALGLYFTEEKLLTQLSRVAMKNKFEDNQDLKESFNFAYEAWMHHEKFGKLQKKLDEFFDTHFNRIYNNLIEIIENSKKINIKDEFFDRRGMNLHRRDFNFMKELKAEIFKETREKYGSNKYSQFMSWLKIADSIDDGNKKKKSLAEFIAACIIGGNY